MADTKNDGGSEYLPKKKKQKLASSNLSIDRRLMHNIPAADLDDNDAEDDATDEEPDELDEDEEESSIDILNALMEAPFEDPTEPIFDYFSEPTPADTEHFKSTNSKALSFFRESLDTTRAMFAKIAPELDVPSNQELLIGCIDFFALKRGYNAYKNLGYKPLLVMAPINLSKTQLKSMLYNLKEWQSLNEPDSPKDRSLRLYSFAEILWFSDVAEREYDNWIINSIHNVRPKVHTSEGLMWHVIVIPTVNVKMMDGSTKNSYDLKKINKHLNIFTNVARNANGRRPKPSTMNMPICSYFVAQALCTYMKRDILDSAGYTLLNGNSGHQAPLGYFNRGGGRFSLGGVDASYFRGWLGVRPVIWG